MDENTCERTLESWKVAFLDPLRSRWLPWVGYLVGVFEKARSPGSDYGSDVCSPTNMYMISNSLLALKLSELNYRSKILKAS